MSKDISATLAERGVTHGDFKIHARITQNLKRAMLASPNWDRLTDAQRESLEMQAHKQGRILAGDPEHADSWHDIAGYAKLVENDLL
jgi:hypothetical protein